MKITWSTIAVEQVREIASYLALDKPSAAENWIEGIFESVDRLAGFPQSGRMVPEIKRNEIREIVQGSYRVIYKVQETQILILLVKAYRQKLKENEIEP